MLSTSGRPGSGGLGWGERDGVGRADEGAERTTDAVGGARQPRQRPGHLQAGGGAHGGAVAAAGAAGLVQQRQPVGDHADSSPRTPPINPATASGKVSGGSGGRWTRAAPRSQASPASRACSASPTTTAAASGHRAPTLSKRVNSRSRSRP